MAGNTSLEKKTRTLKTSEPTPSMSEAGIPVVIAAGVGVLYHVDHLLRHLGAIRVS